MRSALEFDLAMDPSTVSFGNLSEIDRSLRWPALFFIVAAVKWLAAASLLALLSFHQETHPAFLSDHEWLTYGRLRAAYETCFLYGWGFNAAFAVGIWIMARLCHFRIRSSGILVTASCFWQAAVLLGVIGILSGDMTSLSWLQMPVYAVPLLFFSYALIGIWGMLAFRFRRSPQVYVSQWYILAALFWFPWLYSVAQVMILFEPARGVIQSIVEEWYGAGLSGLWFASIALGSLYYFIPKVLGRPLYGYYLSVLAFWLFAFLTGWTGVSHLAGGPVPAWVVSAGVVASLLLLAPVLIITVNHQRTLRGPLREVSESPTLRFIYFASLSFTLVYLVEAATALRSIREVTQFTVFEEGVRQQNLYAFFSMAMFGSTYFILPRLLCRQWPSANLIRFHFWTSSLGIVIVLGALYVGGWRQGLQMNAFDGEGAPLHAIGEVTAGLLPWLHARMLGYCLLTIGNLSFMTHIFWMVYAFLKNEATKGLSTFLAPPKSKFGVSPFPEST